MGMSAGSGGGVKSRMNVTPLVDVVLVLLVIFMVTMPVMMRSISIEVPPEAESYHAPESIPILVKAMFDGTLEISDGASEEVVQRTQLARVLRSKLEEVPGKKVVFVDFEDAVLWDEVVSVMDTAKGVGSRQKPVTVALRKSPR